MQYGEIWQLGEHRLMCGDATRREDIDKLIDGKKIELILTDPPYGILKSQEVNWDKKPNLKLMWLEFERVAKENAAIVIFSQLPFGAELIISNFKKFRYEWIYEKNIAGGFLNAHKMPLRAHENIMVFYRKLPVYNPQKTKGKPYTNKMVNYNLIKPFDIRGTAKYAYRAESKDGSRYPRAVLYFKRERKSYHATQKPVELLEYLIKTYTNEGEIVLDSYFGSGSTAVAAINTNRNFINSAGHPRLQSWVSCAINEKKRGNEKEN